MKTLFVILSLLVTMNLFSQSKDLVPQKFTNIPPSELKITVSSRLNDNCFRDFDEYTTNDMFPFGAYDIKMKFYISPKIDYVQRVFITGLTKPNYFFTVGINFKF